MTGGAEAARAPGSGVGVGPPASVAGDRRS